MDRRARSSRSSDAVAATAPSTASTGSRDPLDRPATPLRLALLALPGVALGVAGMTHPARLTYETSHHWYQMHVVALFVFPLVGVALAALAWPRRDPLALVLYAGAYLYATAYTALDLIAGATAGWVTHRLGPGVERPVEVNYVFEIGNKLGSAGEIGLVVAAVTACVLVARRAGLRVFVGALPLLVGVVLHVQDHIYRPWGASGAILIGLGTAGLAWSASRR